MVSDARLSQAISDARRQYRSHTALSERVSAVHRPRLGSGNDPIRVKPTSAKVMMRSRQQRAQGGNLRRGSEFAFPPSGIYSQVKPPKVDRTIICNDGNVHISVLNPPQTEETSSDVKEPIIKYFPSIIA